jgi:hypothetical protein
MTEQRHPELRPTEARSADRGGPRIAALLDRLSLPQWFETWWSEWAAKTWEAKETW